jgi:hypothetical protein
MDAAAARREAGTATGAGAGPETRTVATEAFDRGFVGGFMVSGWGETAGDPGGVVAGVGAGAGAGAGLMEAGGVAVTGLPATTGGVGGAAVVGMAFGGSTVGTTLGGLTGIGVAVLGAAAFAAAAAEAVGVIGWPQAPQNRASASISTAQCGQWGIGASLSRKRDP